MINDRISTGSMAVLLALLRVFTEATALPGTNVGYGMQRFTVIVLSFLLTAAVYLPLTAVLKRTGGEPPLSVISAKSKLLSGFTGVMLSGYLIYCAAETGLRSHYYTSSTVFDSAPSLYFYIFAGAALIFAVYKGTEASSRTACISAVGLMLLLVLILLALIPDIRTDRLYPAFTDTPETLMTDVIHEFSLNGEYLVFLLMCGHVRGRRAFAVPVYLGVSCGVLLMMTFLYDTVFGHLTSALDFPFYTLSSLSDITLLHRINGIDVMVWSAAGILRMAFFALSFRETVRTCFAGEKASLAAAILFCIASLALAELFTAYPAQFEPLHKVSLSGIPLIFVALFVPLAAFICTLGRKETAH